MLCCRLNASERLAIARDRKLSARPNTVKKYEGLNQRFEVGELMNFSASLVELVTDTLRLCPEFTLAAETKLCAFCSGS